MAGSLEDQFMRDIPSMRMVSALHLPDITNGPALVQAFHVSNDLCSARNEIPVLDAKGGTPGGLRQEAQRGRKRR